MNNFKVGYPRPEQHCRAHVVPSDIVSSEEINLKERQEALEYLLESGADLVYGDLIMFFCIPEDYNDGVFILGEREILQLDYRLDKYGALPREFRSLTNGVSPRYWVPGSEYCEDGFNPVLPGNEFKVGIRLNLIIWVDLSSVREEALSNIRIRNCYGGGGQRLEIITTFTIENVRRTLEYCVTQDSEDVLKDFKEHLFLLGPLPFDMTTDNEDDEDFSNGRKFYLKSRYAYTNKEIVEMEGPVVDRVQNTKSARN